MIKKTLIAVTLEFVNVVKQISKKGWTGFSRKMERHSNREPKISVILNHCIYFLLL